jgi:ASC-1-like (ASCH) protein
MSRKLLKLDKKFWDLIADGYKTKEYRKLNKRYIKQGDYIIFCDLSCEVIYGEVIVEEVNILTLEEVKERDLDNETRFFIDTNYSDEEYLLEFKLESIKTPK